MDPPETPDKAERFEKQILVHLDDLYRAAMRLTNQFCDAEDLVQETCLRAFKSFDQLRHPAAAKVWLFSILRSVYFRQEERRLSRGVSVSLDDIAASFLTAGETPPESDRLFVSPQQVRREEIREAVLKLPVVYREAIVLAHVVGFSYREMAQILGLPVGTVMSRLFRGRRMLRTFLRDRPSRSVTAS